MLFLQPAAIQLALCKHKLERAKDAWCLQVVSFGAASNKEIGKDNEGDWQSPRRDFLGIRVYFLVQS